jgi:hypothetical protein
MRIKTLFSLTLLALTAGIVGCGSDSVGKTYPVKGKVTVNGKALTRGSVAFWPDASKGNASKLEAGGDIKEDGTYELFTSGKRGAPPGAYKVTIAAQTEADSTKPDKAKSLVPEAYTGKETTTLFIEVVESPSPNAYDLVVK